MRTITTTTGAEIALDGDLLAIIETLYQEVTARRELDRSYEDMMREIRHLIGQMTEEERRDYLAESLFHNTVRFENERLAAYMQKLAPGQEEAQGRLDASDGAEQPAVCLATIPRNRRAAARPQAPRAPGPHRLLHQLPRVALLEDLRGERGVQRVPAAVRDQVADHRGADQRQVADHVQDLVAHELVLEPQRVVQHARLADHDRVLERAAEREAVLPQHLDFLQEAEGARRRDLLDERRLGDRASSAPGAAAAGDRS